MLRTHKLGEADRIITLLTRRNGKVRAVARGIRRTSSKFGAKLEPFSHVDVQFVDGRSLAVITQAESVRVHGALLAGDFRRYSAGQVMLETADRLVAEEREPSVQQFLLLVGALNALYDDTGRPATLLLDAYLLRSLAVAGYAPSCSDCARCGVTGPHQAFAPALGGAVCARCRPPGCARPAPETLVLLGALLEGRWADAEDVDPRVAREASGLVSAYVTWHLERGLRSLPLVERG